MLTDTTHGAPGQQPDNKKMQELILYLAIRSHSDPSFGSTKLNKLLFFADSVAYMQLGRSITGFAYERWDHGPCPQGINSIKHQMHQQQDLLVEQKHKIGVIKTYRQDVHHALRDPDLDVFSPYEINIINEVLNLFDGQTAKAVSNLSHTFIGWQVAGNREVIPYGVIKVSPDVTVTDELKRHGKALAERIAARGKHN